MPSAGQARTLCFWFGDPIDSARFTGNIRKLAGTTQLRGEPGHERLLLSVARPGQPERLFAKLFEFLSLASWRLTHQVKLTRSLSKTPLRKSRSRPPSMANTSKRSAPSRGWVARQVETR